MQTPTMQVFDKNFKRLGTLIDAYQIERRRKLNSDNELSFLVPMSTDDYLEKLQIKGHVMDERGQYYVINTRQRQRDKKQLTALITATHVMFKLNDYKVPYDAYIAEAYGIHITSLLDKITSWTGGRFTFVVHDTFDLWDIKDFGRTTALAALNQVISLFGAEIRPDNFVIHVHKKIGADNRFEFRTKKNIIKDSFKDDATSLVTRMYAQMKDGRTFVGLSTNELTAEELSLLQSVPGAISNGKINVNYLISPYVNYWGSNSVPFFDGEVVEQDIEDPVELLRATREALRKKEMPELEITVDSADLHKIDKEERPPDLGDNATVYDPNMDMNRIAVRVVELTEYPYSISQHSRITLSNFALQDDIDIIADLERSAKIMSNLLSGGRIRTETFETFAKQAVIDVNNSKTQIIYDTRGILLQDQTNHNNQVILTSNGVVLTTDAGQTARTAITARGIVAEQIVGQLGDFVSLVIGSGNNVTKINTNGISAGHADYNLAPFQVDMQGNVVARSIKLTGQIDNSEMQSSEIRASTVRASTLIGNEIEGGVITGALFRTARSGRRIEINSTGLIAYNSSGQEAISLGQSSNGGHLVFSDNGSPAGEIFADTNGLQIGNMGSVYIGSRDDYTYLRGAINFERATEVQGLAMHHIDGLDDELRAIRGEINNIRVQIFEDMVINADFDNATRNLKLYSRGSTVATVNIPVD